MAYTEQFWQYEDDVIPGLCRIPLPTPETEIEADAGAGARTGLEDEDEDYSATEDGSNYSDEMSEDDR